METMRKANCHVHLPPNFSAFTTIAQAVELAAEQGVRVLGASNYYDYSIYNEFAELAKKRGVVPLFGLEIICLVEELLKAGVKINDPGNPGKLYLCGKGITRFNEMNEEATELLGKIRRNDSGRMAKMIGKIEEVFVRGGVKTGVSEKSVKEMIARRHGSPMESIYLQERHVAQAFQEAFFGAVKAEDRVAAFEKVSGVKVKSDPNDGVKFQNEIRSHLMKAGKAGYVEETFVTFEEARRLILALGGFVCYPILADGATPICPFEGPVEKLIGELKERGIGAAELIPGRNKPEVLGEYARKLRAAGIVVTGGTEHNSLDLVPLELSCAGGVAIPEDVAEIFWEGACVVAGHQYLVGKGEVGFTGVESIERVARVGTEVVLRT